MPYPLLRAILPGVAALLASPAFCSDIAWTTCDAAIIDQYPNLVDRMQCGTASVPQDHRMADGQRIALPLVRIQAASPSLRLGALFLNPGGPGASATGFTLAAADLFGMADPAHPVARHQRNLADRYDFIGLQPRGVDDRIGSLRCRSDAVNLAVRDFAEDRSEVNMLAAEHNAALAAAACLEQPDIGLVNTWQVANDLEWVRRALGEPKLNYFGVSYGTFLGAWYASMFPGSVGRMLLDSNMNWRSSFDEAVLGQAPGYQHTFDTAIAGYVASRADYFNLGNTAAEVAALFRRAPAALRSAMRFWVSLPNKAEREFTGHALMAVSAISTILREHPDIDETGMRAALASFQFSDDPKAREAGLKAAMGAVAIYFRAPELPGKVELETVESVFLAVSCNDTASERDPTYWRLLGDFYEEHYPVFGSKQLTGPCRFWPEVDRFKPDFSALGDVPGLLMIQNADDPVTPLAGALKAFEPSESAGMVIVEGDYTHGVFPHGSSCLDAIVGDFFIKGHHPGRGALMTCAPVALPSVERASYRDPVRARALLRVMREAPLLWR